MLKKVLKILLIITCLLILICLFIDMYLVPIAISLFFLLYTIYNVIKTPKQEEISENIEPKKQAIVKSLWDRSPHELDFWEKH